jgi:hypothetical protein
VDHTVKFAAFRADVSLRGVENGRLTPPVPVVRDMLDKLGTVGLVGLVALVVGVVLVAWRAPVVAVGLVLVLAGVGLVARSLIQNAMAAFGLA